MNLILSLAVLAASIIVYSSFLRPAYEEINGMRGDLSSKTEFLENQKKIVDEVKGLLEEYQTLAGPRQTVSLVLPTVEEYPSAVNQMSSLARASGLVLGSVATTKLPFEQSTTQQTGEPAVSVLQLVINLNGPYQAFKNFINSVESNIRLFDIVSFEIGSSQGGGDNYPYNMVVNAYYQSL